MKIKIYGIPFSPMVRKVHLCLHLKSVYFDINPISFLEITEAYRKLHPLGKIPLYQDDDITLPDSSVICDYIDHRFHGQKLYPQDCVSRAKALWLEEYADTHLLRTLGLNLFFERIIKPYYLKEPCLLPKVNKTIEKQIPQILDYLETVLPANHFIGGKKLMVADISITSHFLNARYANYTIDADVWPITAHYINRVLETKLFHQRAQNEQSIYPALNAFQAAY